MGLFDKIFKRGIAEQGFTVENGVLKLVDEGGDTRLVVNVNHTTAMQVPAIYTAVKVISETFASLPYTVYNSAGEEVERDLTRAINTTPNQYMSGYMFKKTMMRNLALKGNAYAEIVRNTQGVPDQTFELMPRLNVRRINRRQMGANTEEFTDFYEVSDKGLFRVVQPSNMIHLMGDTEDGLKGISPIGAMPKVVAIYLLSTLYGESFFKNSGRPATLINLDIDETLNDQMQTSLRTQWKKNETLGVQFMGKGSVTPLTVSPDEAQFIETKNYVVQEVARMFHIPLSKISDVSNRTYNNIEQEAKEFITETLVPHIEAWQSELNRKFFVGLREEGKFSYEELVKPSMEDRYSAYSIATGGRAWKTPNEIRISEGDEPLPEFDEQDNTPEPVQEEEQEEIIEEEEDEESGNQNS